MWMDDGQIYRSWKGAKKPDEQISVLAELNDCSAKTICDAITRHEERMKQTMTTATTWNSAKDAELAALNAEGLTFQEIADRMGTSASNIARRWKHLKTVGEIAPKNKTSDEETETSLINSSETGVEPVKQAEIASDEIEEKTTENEVVKGEKMTKNAQKADGFVSVMMEQVNTCLKQGYEIDEIHAARKSAYVCYTTAAGKKLKWSLEEITDGE